MKRIAIYGGSFNPVHSGHVKLALRAAFEHNLEKVLVVPAKVSPFKTGLAPDKVMFTDEERWSLVKLACRGLSVLEPCDCELKRGGISYAVDTVCEIRARHPGAEIFFIIGEDSVKDLERWHDWPRLKRLARFIAYPRTCESSTEIRRRLKSGEKIDDLVPPAVAAAIAKMRP